MLCNATSPPAWQKAVSLFRDISESIKEKHIRKENRREKGQEKMKVHPGKDKSTASRKGGKTLETYDTPYRTNTRYAR